MKKHFDVIVFGVGSMGSATCYELASRGVSVLGIEQFGIVHDKGSHSGHTRIIRKAYFEHPDYVPLLERSYENWKRLEGKAGEKIYYESGLLYMDLTEGEVYRGVKESSEKHGIHVDILDDEALKEMYPTVSIPEGYQALREPEAGYLDASRAIWAYAKLAMERGAIIHTNEKVVSWEISDEEVVVHTDDCRYHCDRLVISAGPWAEQWLSQKGMLSVTQQALIWVDVACVIDIPSWLIGRRDGKGAFYGFPYTSGELNKGYKIGWHYPGNPALVGSSVAAIKPDERQELMEALQWMLSDVMLTVSNSATCYYTNTPDDHFILDFLPESEQRVVIAAGFSGHGFKFASVVGELMTDLAIDGNSNLPYQFLKLDRFY